MSQITLLIPRPMKWTLREIAARKQTTVARLVPQILENYIASEAAEGKVA